MKKGLLLIVIAFMLTGNLFAAGRMQNGPEPAPQYYQYMVFRMTEDLKLTSEQAEKLFPIMHPYREAKRQLHEKMMVLCERAYHEDAFTKKDQEYFLAEVKRLHLDELKLDDELYAKVETFLDPDQVVKFIFFEQRFRMELSRELKDRYQGEHKEHPKKKIEWRQWKNK